MTGPIHRAVPVTLALLTALAGPLLAQQPAASPESAARTFFQALEGERWADAARMIHPAALARYRESTVASLRSALNPTAFRPTTVDELLRLDPAMPREVAEYQARRSNEDRTGYSRIVFERAGVTSVEELERLPADEAFARFLAANSESRHLARSIEGKVDSVAARLIPRIMPRVTRSVIGSTPAPGGEARDAAYVVYSVAHRLPPAPTGLAERVAVVAMRRDGAAWKIDPGESEAHELFGGGNFGVLLEPERSALDLATEVRRVAVWPAQGAPRLRVHMTGAGADPLKQPPTALVVERLAPDGGVAARVEVPAEAWGAVGGIVGLWAMLLPELGPPER